MRDAAAPNVKPVAYRGRRDEPGKAVVEFQQVRGEKWFPLPLRLDLREHSPTGFEWGYGGSGPAQLALAITATRLAADEALEIYQEVKREIVQNHLYGQAAWELSGVTVDTAIRAAQDHRDRKRREV